MTKLTLDSVLARVDSVTKADAGPEPGRTATYKGVKVEGMTNGNFRLYRPNGKWESNRGNWHEVKAYIERNLSTLTGAEARADKDASVTEYKGHQIRRMSPGTYQIKLGGGKEKLAKSMDEAKGIIDKMAKADAEESRVDAVNKARAEEIAGHLIRFAGGAPESEIAAKIRLNIDDPETAALAMKLWRKGRKANPLNLDSVLARVDAVCKADFRESKAYGKEYGDFEYKGYDVYAGEGDGKWHIYRGRNLIEKASSKAAAKSAIEGMKPHVRKDEAGGSEGDRPFDRADAAGTDLSEVTAAPDPIADASPAEMMLAAGCMVIADNGSILFMKRKDTGQWAFPGGRVEDGEGPAETALRELFEETGHKADGHNGLLTRRKSDGVDFTTFAVRVPEPFAPKMNDEHSAFAWLRPDDLAGPVVLADELRADDANWREEDHPRAKDGKFGSGGGGASPNKDKGGSEEKPTSGGEGGQGGGEKAAKGGEGAGKGEGGSTASQTAARPPREKAASSLMEPHYDKLPKTDAEKIALGDKIAKEVGADKLLAEARQKIAALGGKETKSLVKDGGHLIDKDNYTPERSNLHAEILEKFFNAADVKRAKPKPGEKPTMIMLGGRGGSGKSWFTNQHEGDNSPIDHEKFLVIDSDHFKGELPEYEGWNAGQLHEESSDILDRAAQMALDMGLNVIFDVTMKSTRSVEERIVQYKGSDKDYDVQGFYMHAPPEKAVKQAMMRFKRGMEKNGKGRLVPPEIILSNVDNEANFDKAKKSFSKWAVYHNSDDGIKLHANSDDKD